MKKNRLSNSFKWTLGGGIFCIFLLIPEMWIAKLITQNDPESFKSCFIMIVIFTISVYAIFGIVKVVQYQKWFKEYERERLEKAKKELSKEK